MGLWVGVKTVITVDVTVGIDINNFKILYDGSGTPSSTNTEYKIFKPDADFLNDGVKVGSSIAFTFDPNIKGVTVHTIPFTVTSITSDSLSVTCTGTPEQISTVFSEVNNKDLQEFQNPELYSGVTII